MSDIMITNDNLIPKSSENQIVKVVKQLADLKAQEKALKEALLEEMEKRGIKKIDTPKLTITHIDATTKETFDTKAFREKHRDLYDEYASLSEVKAYVKIGVK